LEDGPAQFYLAANGVTRTSVIDGNRDWYSIERVPEFVRLAQHHREGRALRSQAPHCPYTRSGDRLFIKPTEGGRAFIGNVVEDSPYPGAKPSLLIEDQVDDSEWLSELAKITARELPVPKPKKSKKNKGTPKK